MVKSIRTWRYNIYTLTYVRYTFLLYMYINIYNIFVSHKVFFISYISFKLTYLFTPFLLPLSLLPKLGSDWMNHLNCSSPSPRRSLLHLSFPCPLGSTLPSAPGPADCCRHYSHGPQVSVSWISPDPSPLG